jgi:sugar phosphate isomerase/epimerase
MPTALSVWLDAYPAGLRDALDRAAAQGFTAVEPNAARPDFDPRSFGASARRHLQKYLRDLGLRFDTIALQHPGGGLVDPARADERLAQFRQTLALCRDLGVARASIRVAGLADPATAGSAAELLAEVADQADRTGILTHVYAPQDPPAKLTECIARLGCPHLALGLDTAQGLPHELAAGVTGLLGQLYLRDVQRSGDRATEVPLGQGDVDFRAWLAALAGAERSPLLVVRREPGPGVDALRRGREYIQSLLPAEPHA